MRDRSAPQGVVWITGETELSKIGQCTQGSPDFDFMTE